MSAHRSEGIEKTMDKIKNLMVLGVFVLGCGAAEEGDYEEEEVEMGSIEQPFHGKRTPSFQYGTRTSSTRQKCNRSSSGQVCSIPPSKTLTYCVPALGGVQSWAPAEVARVKAIIEGLDSISDFTLNDVSPPAGTPCSSVSPTPKMTFIPDPVGASGSASNDVNDYVMSYPSGLSSLTEGTGVVGSYQSWRVCDVGIDMVDIRAKGTTVTQENNGVDHSTSHGLLACLGIGGRSGDGGRASRNLFNLDTTATNVSTGEACQILGFTLSSPGQFNNSLTGDCAAD